MTMYQEISEIYARSLIEAGEESNCLQELTEDISMILEICRQTPELKKFLLASTLSDNEKFSVIDKIIFPNFSSDLTKNFIKVLKKNKRISILSGICEEFFLILEKKNGICRAKLLTAYPFSKDFLDELVKKLELNFQKKFKVEHILKTDLIGGFRFIFEDKMLDCSIEKYLNEFKSKVAS